MSNFITDGSAVIPSVKTDKRSPSGATTEIKAADLNQIRQALLDLRSQVILASQGTPGSLNFTNAGAGSIVGATLDVAGSSGTAGAFPVPLEFFQESAGVAGLQWNGLLPFAWAKWINGSGAADQSSALVLSTQRMFAGVYKVTVNWTFSTGSGGDIYPVATLNGTGTGASIVAVQLSASEVAITIKNAAGTQVDSGFCVLLFV